MREVLRTSDGVITAALQQALGAVGVPFQVTNEVGNVYLNVMELVVWVPQNADMKAVEKAFEEVKQRYAARMKVRPGTQVSVSDEVVRCEKCGYDLRGQVEDGRCPECGHAYVLAVPRKCPQCGEDSPADFAVCWQCGGDLDGSEEAEEKDPTVEGPAPQQPPQAQ